MLVYVDGKKRGDADTKDRTVGELLTDIKSEAAKKGKMIVAIICDGENLAPDQISEVLTKSADAYSKIDFQTAKPAELARNSLTASKEFLAYIEGNCREIVLSLRQAQIQQAMEQMNPMFSRLNDSYKALQGTFQLLKLDPESIELSTGNAGAFMTGLVDTLRQIKIALENQDYVALADLFEYELSPAIIQWQELNDHILEQVAQASSL